MRCVIAWINCNVRASHANVTVNGVTTCARAGCTWRRPGRTK